ncbi:c-type cytochrome [Methylotenera sp.]|uniref:c-type cytochrome n=1 Tax=Methylotenera sp. TaxID=2051956 RepID=UPI0027236ECD|nr:c-type cytochrome [Methylotenera sp.]MDO9206432.1 c-type cytochrome [Methylotenera sp.]MDO9392701.1 c-type cytochrome [Methylotenera sp.]MDP1521848.1 c-type cytochrome [Methylotenera sp.]MDP2070692.1 c-type cytochrome [Methylotenera sp.]MDP2231446.1 c-type cytochrome [Methylotenera sp.]
MNKYLLLTVLLATLGACDKSGSDASSGGSAPEAAAVKAIEFVATQDGAPIKIDAALFDTPAAKDFLATGKNPYIGNDEAIVKGKKVFQMYSCVACHGGHAEGAVATGLIGPNFKYAKNATNKGMFETIWHGTNGGMGAKGIGLMDPTDPKNGVTVDETLKVIAWIRSVSTGITGNE